MNDTDEWQARMVIAHENLKAECDALREQRARDTELILNARLDAVALRERIKTLADAVGESEGGGLYVGPDDILALLGGDA